MTRDEHARARLQSEIASLHERATSNTNEVLNAVERRSLMG
jgi:hypothetical protein